MFGVYRVQFTCMLFCNSGSLCVQILSPKIKWFFIFIFKEIQFGKKKTSGKKDFLTASFFCFTWTDIKGRAGGGGGWPSFLCFYSIILELWLHILALIEKDSPLQRLQGKQFCCSTHFSSFLLYFTWLYRTEIKSWSEMTTVQRTNSSSRIMSI